VTRQCPTCGTTLRTQAHFCDNCGCNLATDDPDTVIIPELAQFHADAAPDTIRLPADDSETVVIPELAQPSADAAPDTIRLPADDSETVVIPELAQPSADAAPDTIRLPADDSETVVIPELAQPGDTPKQAPTVIEPSAAATKSPRPAHKTIIGPKPGQVLQGRYRLEKLLGRGGFGAAYLVQDVKLKRACVVKQMLIPPGTPARDADIYRSNFEREAGLLVQLNHPGHPNIPEIYDYFSDAGSNYLVMKYIEGQNLQHIIDQSDGKIPWREAVRYMVDVCDALHYMHSTGGEPVMHRDIKPANILLGNDDRVWLVDFGLAKATPVQGSGDAMATQTAGSLGYTPLEQWQGNAEPASDVYALGATLHHLTTGADPYKPFEGEFFVTKIQEMHGQFPSLRQLDRSLPRELDGIIRQATAANPTQRPTALQLKQQLDAMVSGGQQAALFTFKNGESAHTTPELVDLCEQNRAEAEEYLYHGDFERWFTIINRNDLAEAARQAVAQGKNQADGLEKFLKLAIPHLFWRRLGRAGWRVSRAVIMFLLIFLLAVAVLITASSYGLRWLLQRSIATYNWDYYALDLEQDNIYTETYLNRITRSATSAYLQGVEVDVRSPNQLGFKANFANIMNLDLPVTIQHQKNQPRFYITQLNNMPLYLIGDNITQGINRGLEEMFQQAPIDITTLTVSDEDITFRVSKSGRVPWRPPPTPIVAPTPIPTPTPEGLALIAIFNEVEHDLILELDGETWTIPAFDTKAIEKWPGTYDYTVRYTNGQFAAQGRKTWYAKAYKWRIDLAEE
jgi:serine/threonine protein kinase